MSKNLYSSGGLWALEFGRVDVDCLLARALRRASSAFSVSESRELSVAENNVVWSGSWLRCDDDIERNDDMCSN